MVLLDDYVSVLYYCIRCCLQNMKLKIISSSVSAERRFSSWIGGSILASLVSLDILLVIVNKLSVT